jgi:hypothetical protein
MKKTVNWLLRIMLRKTCETGYCGGGRSDRGGTMCTRGDWRFPGEGDNCI